MKVVKYLNGNGVEVMIFGNTEGIRDTVLERLEKIYEINVSKDSILSKELFEHILVSGSEINREISVAIDRKGKVVGVSVGDSTTVEIPAVDIRERRLSGIRIIHTHPNGNSRLSALDMSALIKFKLDCIVAIGLIDNEVTDITIGFCDVKEDILSGEMIGPMTAKDIFEYDFLDKIKYIDIDIKASNIIEDDSERAILVGIESEKSLEELMELTKACEIKVVDSVLQKRNKIDTAFYIGSGKAEELTYLSQAERANLFIFDDELSGSQVRNLEDYTGVKVIDRTTLILDIFARRARSKEAKIQVELAQLKYRTSRLSGLGTVLSRTGGGIGTRGPGEKKLETDRRHIKERIYDLTSELEKVKKTREIQREKRNNIPKVSLVGYTNAGKSTLRNKLCDIAMPKDIIFKEKVFEADMLFATLDTTTRAIVLPDSRLITVTDTVGFVNKLPHDLIEAFKSTLEEVTSSDLLVHVVDASVDDVYGQVTAVENVLKELEVQDKPVILALNKIDKVEDLKIEEIKKNFNYIKIIEISAKHDINLDLLLREISKSLPFTLKKAEYLIPYTEQSMVAFLHRNARIDNEEYKEDGTHISALVDDEVYSKCKDFIVQK